MPMLPELEEELRLIHAHYRALAGFGLDAERGLGGKLLWAGALDAESARLIRAASIAGAASLAACDAVGGKQAMRAGGVDFLVTSLDEALRILKNEIRKKTTVAVAVAQPAEAVEAEMLARGVLPDLLPAWSSSDAATFLAQGARRLPHAAPPSPGRLFAIVELAAPGQQAQIESALASVLDHSDAAGLRWLRLSTRYLPATMRRLRSLECAKEENARRMEAIRKLGRQER